MIKNVNKEKLVQTLKTGSLCLAFGVVIGTCVAGYGNKYKNNQDVIETTIDSSKKVKKITKLNVEEFEKLVDSVEEANKKVDFNLRRENLELALYINNISLATPELVEQIESYYNYNEEDMINVYLKTMTAYNNDKNDYYNGKDDKSADVSLMFVDEIDKDAIKYVDELFEGLYENVSSNSEIKLTMDKFNMMVEDIINKNNELGIDINKEDLEISIYQRNSKYAQEDVKKYISSLKTEQDFESVDLHVISIYKRFNKNSEKQFNLSSLEFESYYIEMVVDELEAYTRENGKINGYTKDQLTVGGLFTIKMKIDDAFAYFATTGYANDYEQNISAIAEANLEACVARTYAALGSKASIKECETEKVNTLK